MSDRVHILLDPAEKARFRRLAAMEGKSLSAWLRDLARQRAAEERRSIVGIEELGDFFAGCDAREVGREPDWEEHRKVIERGAGSGNSGT